MRDGVVPITLPARAGPSVMAAIPPTCRRELLSARYRAAPGHGPGVAASGSSSTFVSNSLKPRRR